VPGKLFEQLQIGETQADNLDLPQNLMGTRLEHRLGFVDLQLVRSDQLHRTLFSRNGCRCHIKSMQLRQNLLWA